MVLLATLFDINDIPSHPTFIKRPIFHADGKTIDLQSSTYHHLKTYAFAARAAGTDTVPFDVDSFDIAMDNCASRTMTFCPSDFITPIVDADVKSVTGAGGGVSVQGMGDVQYSVVDDDGMYHSLVIKDTLYVPSVPFRLLSANQLAKQIEKVPGSEGTGIFSFGWHSKFKWNHQQYCKTIVHRENIDIPVMEANTAVILHILHFTNHLLHFLKILRIELQLFDTPLQLFLIMMIRNLSLLKMILLITLMNLNIVLFVLTFLSPKRYQSFYLLLLRKLFLLYLLRIPLLTLRLLITFPCTNRTRITKLPNI